ncbi:MAG: succinylglutamate desuccinylase/aspartoacylase family protein [Candidatus Sumerlaeia bacterium]|nr:succinylglutamate desuccinylase/aspartoacylase family protein [Candidatus Sumerlaeia bacterium]
MPCKKLWLPATVAALTATSVLTAQVTFDSSFESGNGTNFTQVSPGIYSFQLEPDANSTDRQWFYFEVNGAAGQTITFRLLNTNTHNVTGHWNTARPIFSTDGGLTWDHVGGSTSHSSNVYTFSHTFIENSERIAFHHPYTVTMAEEKMDAWEPHPDVTRTTLGQSVQGRDIDLFRVTDESAGNDNDKLGFWVICRLHAAEVTASFSTEAFMDFLLSNNPEAVALRQNAVINVVPMANPDGVIIGNYRNNAAGINLNRVWNGTANNNTSPEVVAIQGAIDQWVADGKPYDIFLDMHSTSGANPHFAFHAAANQEPPLYFDPPNYHNHSRAFLAFVNDHAPHFNPTQGASTSTSQLLAYHRQRIQYGVLAFTFEGAYNRQNFGPNSSDWMTPVQHRDVGVAMAKALIDYFEIEVTTSGTDCWMAY